MFKKNQLLSHSLLMTILGGLLIVVIISSAGMGYISIPFSEVGSIIVNKISGNNSLLNSSNMHPAIVWEVRLPRILTAAIVGGSLALAGVIFQAILLNPLADPYTLGISSGAAFGASLALLLNISLIGHFSVPLGAFAGALLTLFAVLSLASRDGQYSTTSLILSGVIVAAILSAGIGFIKHLADEHVSAIIFWLMGSFASKNWQDVLLCLAAAVANFSVAVFYGRDLNIMAMGHRTSDSLGINTAQTRKILLIVTSMTTALCVSVAGIIGFVGLIIPHLMRMLVGPDNQKLLPASLLCGALLLVGADTFTRAVLPSEVPIGVLTALIGGPFFCVIFYKKQHAGFGNG